MELADYIQRCHDLSPENRAIAERATCVGVLSVPVAEGRAPTMAWWVLNAIIDRARQEGREESRSESVDKRHEPRL